MRLLPLVVVAVLTVLPAAARAAAPTGFPAPRTIAADLQVEKVAAAPSAVAYLDASGDVWATRVQADGTPGSPLPAAQAQRDARDLQVVVTDRRELVVLWAAIADRTHAVIRCAVALPGRSFSGARTLATVSTNTGATPRMAALRGGTIAVVYRDPRPPAARGVLRYARRPPGGAFGAARSLGRDGVAPEIAATPGGGALLAWGSGPLARRNLVIATARRDAPVPGPGASLAGRVRSFTLAASADGTAWVTWTRRDPSTTGFARRLRDGNVAAVGPVQAVGAVAYGVPHVALGGSGEVLATWSAQGPGSLPGPDVALASASGTGAALGAPLPFDAGGFSQTSPLPAYAGSVPLVLFTRQVPIPGGALHNEVVAADPASGDGVVLGAPRTIAPPALARPGAGLLVAWPASTGGVAVTLHP